MNVFFPLNNDNTNKSDGAILLRNTHASFSDVIDFGRHLVSVGFQRAI